MNSIPRFAKKKKPQAKIRSTVTALVFSLSSCLIMGTYSLNKIGFDSEVLSDLVSSSECCLDIDEVEQLGI